MNVMNNRTIVKLPVANLRQHWTAPISPRLWLAVLAQYNFTIGV